MNQLVSLCLVPGGKPQPLRRETWEEIIELALYHGVAPLLWSRLKDRELPAPIRARLAGIYASNLARNQELKAAQERVLGAFRGEAIPALPFKGVQLSEELYGDLGLRQTVDIDILIQPQDLEKANRGLRALGYSRPSLDEVARFRRSKALLYLKLTGPGQSISLDLHLRLLPYRQPDPLVERVWEQGMTKENLLLYLCANQVSHRFARLKHLLDVKMLVERTANELDWDLVVAGARELALTPGIYYSLESLREFLGARVPAPVLAALRPGWFDRRFVGWTLGADPLTTLARGPALAGPYGVFAALACTRGFVPRLRLARQLLFPPTEELRTDYRAHPQRASLPLYLHRLVRKVPTAVRGLFKAVF